MVTAALRSVFAQETAEEIDCGNSDLARFKVLVERLDAIYTRRAPIQRVPLLTPCHPQ